MKVGRVLPTFFFFFGRVCVGVYMNLFLILDPKDWLDSIFCSNMNFSFILHDMIMSCFLPLHNPFVFLLTVFVRLFTCPYFF
jgi:hypothetical protein